MFAGEVHALVGENGAGKSTLIKIMTGAEARDCGTITIGDRVLSHLDPAAAHALGIAAVYQQPALFPHLTVTENLAMAARRPVRGGGSTGRRAAIARVTCCRRLARRSIPIARSTR